MCKTEETCVRQQEKLALLKKKLIIFAKIQVIFEKILAKNKMFGRFSQK
jgi:hypothetical protein